MYVCMYACMHACMPAPQGHHRPQEKRTTPQTRATPQPSTTGPQGGGGVYPPYTMRGGGWGLRRCTINIAAASPRDVPRWAVLLLASNLTSATATSIQRPGRHFFCARQRAPVMRDPGARLTVGERTATVALQVAKYSRLLHAGRPGKAGT